MTADTTGHRGYIRNLYGYVHLSHIPVTGDTTDAGIGMSAMTPIHKRGYRVHLFPGDRFPSLRGGPGQLLNGRAIRGHFCVAAHASLGRRQSHLVTGIGVGVAKRASQLQSHMSLVAKRDWLFHDRLLCMSSQWQPHGQQKACKHGSSAHLINNAMGDA